MNIRILAGVACAAVMVPALPAGAQTVPISQASVEAINQAFRNSIKEFSYQGQYRGVFPIKVNQLREVVEEILDAGKPYNFGLEVGSKPELFAGTSPGAWDVGTEVVTV